MTAYSSQSLGLSTVEPSAWAQELAPISEQWLMEPAVSGYPSPGSVVGVVTQLPKLNIWDKLWKPWGEALGTVGTVAGGLYEKLPEILFETGMEKLGGSTARSVSQGAGTTTVYTQPAQPGGAPASQPLIIIPPGGGGGIVQVPAQAAGGLSMTTLVVIGIGLVLIMWMRK